MCILVIILCCFFIFHCLQVDSNVVCYIAGYTSVKINRNTVCPDSKEAFVKSKKMHSHVKKGENIDQDETVRLGKSGLVIPSPQLYELCYSIDCVVQMNIEGIMTGAHVMGTLKDCITQSLEVDSFKVDACCSEHQKDWVCKAITLYLCLEIHHRVRNQELKRAGC